MRGVSKVWLGIVFLLSLLSVVLLVPSFAGDSLPGWWSRAFPTQGIRLGLDLRGGVFLQLGVRSDLALEQELNTIRNTITQGIQEERGLIKSTTVDNGLLLINFFSSDDLNKAKSIARHNFDTIADIEERDLSLAISLSQSYIDEIEENAVRQVKEVIENRVRDFGMVEPSIQAAGGDRILIQVPGASQRDRERIVDLIKRSAVLEFKIVQDSSASRDTLFARYDVADERELRDKGLALHEGITGIENERFFITERDAKVTGEFIADARLIFDDFGRPAVGFRFRGEGATRFGSLTGENIGERLAIVLDERIKSAPVINDRITYEGTITGNFTSTEARDLALVLRSGALPVPVDVQQERTIGPSLGQESIEKGTTSMIVGGILVLICMVFLYRLQGVVANIALLLNMLFIMGFLSAFGITLTLPGIAGLVLTLGMAVDGNIIIFERIKEELRLNKKPIVAIDTGYARSLWTILDANTTTLVTALILFWFGTGPIQGFAATLSIGIASTVFSNLIVARLVTNMIYSGKKVERVSI